MSEDGTHFSTAGLGRRAARGAAYTVGAQLTRIALQLASVVILARLLTPTDYGLVAMVMAIAGVAEIFRDFGLSSAAVQAPTLSRRQRDNLFWINSGIGVVLAGAVFAGAGLIAAVYGKPELVPLTQVICVVFILNGLATQYRAQLNRALRFRALAACDVLATATGLITAVVLAILGAGYWALAAQLLAQAGALLLLLVAFSRWWPGMPTRHEPMAGLLRFGWNLVATQLVNYVGNNTDAFVIGTKLGAASLGIYNRGFQLVFNPVNQLRAPVSSVAIPVLSRLQAERDRYYDFVCRGQVALGYTLVAGLGVMVSAAQPLTSILLGPQWTAVAPVIALLSVAAVFQTLAMVGYWVYVSLGLTATLFRYSLISVAMKMTLVVIGSQWGVTGVAAGFALSSTLAWPISLWWLARTTAVPVARLVWGVVRLASMAGVAGVAGWLAVRATQSLAPFAQLGADLVVTVAANVLAAALVPAIRRDARDLWALVAMLRPPGASAT